MSFRSKTIFFLVVIAPFMGCERAPESPLQAAQKLFRRGEWQKVVEVCSEVIADDPTDAAALLLRGRAFACLADYQHAISDYTSVIELKPEDCEAYHHREIAHRKLGHDDLADADRRRGRSLDPLHKKAYIYEHANFVHQGIDPALLEQTDNSDPKAAADSTARREEGIEDPSGRQDAEAPKDSTTAEVAQSETTAEDTPATDGSLPSSAAANNGSKLTAGNAIADKAVPDAGHSDLYERWMKEQLRRQAAQDVPDSRPRSESSEDEISLPMPPRISTALPTRPGGQVWIPNQVYRPGGSTGSTGSVTALDSLFGPAAPSRKGMVGKFHANPVFDPTAKKSPVLSTSRSQGQIGARISATPSDRPVLSTQLPKQFIPQGGARATGITPDRK